MEAFAFLGSLILDIEWLESHPIPCFVGSCISCIFPGLLKHVLTDDPGVGWLI